MPIYHLEELLRAWSKKEAQQRWLLEPGLRQATSLIVEVPLESWVVGLGRLHWQKLRLVVGSLMVP